MHQRRHRILLEILGRQHLIRPALAETSKNRQVHQGDQSSAGIAMGH